MCDMTLRSFRTHMFRCSTHNRTGLVGDGWSRNCTEDVGFADDHGRKDAKTQLSATWCTQRLVSGAELATQFVDADTGEYLLSTRHSLIKVVTVKGTMVVDGAQSVVCCLLEVDIDIDIDHNKLRVRSYAIYTVSMPNQEHKRLAVTTLCFSVASLALTQYHPLVQPGPAHTHNGRFRPRVADKHH
jgi:hypothetical protein